MKVRNLLLSFFTSFFTYSEGIDSTPNWTLVKKTESIRVYKAAGVNGFKRIRIEARLAVPLVTFIDFVNDVEKYTLWVYKCSRAVHLEAPEKASMKYWMVSDFPFPFKDREITLVSHH